MLLGFKTELKPNNNQVTAFRQHCGGARHAWNQGLQLTKTVLDWNRSNPDEKLKFPTAIDLHKWLVASVKADNPWYYQSSKCAPQYALRALREAWDRCFKKKAAPPRFNRNKEKGSKNWRKAMDRMARLHYRMTCIRRDFLHKLTTYLAKNFQSVCIEDLNVSGMLQFGKLAAAVVLLGFHEFRRQMEYKTKLYGSELVVADRWFPSSKSCSNCGHKKESLLLSERVFQCDQCGFEIDRDLNASLNLASLAGSLPVSACG